VRTRARLTALVAASALLAGCGFGAGAEKKGGAELRVTRGFGTERVVSESTDTVREGDTVMRFLTSKQKVKTRYGGRFVSSIGGLSSASGGAGHSDWFYFVNGSEAEVGAADRKLSPGDVIQWDLHRWDAAMDVPAIVGAFPEPFVHGAEGKRFPVRIECDDDPGPACGVVRDRMSSVDVPAGIGTLGAQDRGEILRILVAPWSALSELGGLLPRLEGAPSESGVFARFAENGSLRLLDDRGGVASTAPPGTGLVAALREHGGQPLWVVTGVDEAGTQRAAKALRAQTLRDAFAVAVTPAGVQKLPVESER
jgi:hypothetical protein